MKHLLWITAASLALVSCASDSGTSNEVMDTYDVNAPLVTDIYTADPSAHVWNDGRLYIYPSHDINTETADTGGGSQFDMKDYVVLSMDQVGGKVTQHDVALDMKDVPWVGKQMWAPDAAYKAGQYYLYFPAKDKAGVFRMGVATSTKPEGPFTAQAKPMAGSYSIDPAVFADKDGEHYIYFGGIWGGQLQKWASGSFDANGSEDDLGDDSAPAIAPRIAKLRGDMLEFAETPREIIINAPDGTPLLAGDHDRRFFEGAWVFERNGKYYFTYSTGDTHFLAYAVGDNPYGPFTYRGRILEPVDGWTSHHSVFEQNGNWYLAYHDTNISRRTHLRNVKIMPLAFDENGDIPTMTPVGP